MKSAKKCGKVNGGKGETPAIISTLKNINKKRILGSETLVLQFSGCLCVSLI